MHQLQRLYLRIADDKYHILKNILEGYDNISILSNQADKLGIVILKYHCGCEKVLFELLADLAGSLKKD